jgi:hypothetical protein
MESNGSFKAYGRLLRRKFPKRGCDSWVKIQIGISLGPDQTLTVSDILMIYVAR